MWPPGPCASRPTPRTTCTSKPKAGWMTSVPTTACSKALGIRARSRAISKSPGTSMRQLVIFACLGFLPATHLSAQRAFSSTYDSARQVKLKGSVTRIEWVNPHAFFFINVQDSSGTVTNWALEFGNPLDLEKDGWKATTLRIGDLVTVEGIPARGPARQAFAKSVVLGRTGAKVFTASGRKRASAAAEPVPRWPDGQVRLGPATGKKGYWSAASANALVERTAAAIP